MNIYWPTSGSCIGILVSFQRYADVSWAFGVVKMAYGYWWLIKQESFRNLDLKHPPVAGQSKQLDMVLNYVCG